MSGTEHEDDLAQDETKTIALTPALTFKGGRYDSLSLREPRAGEVRKAEGLMRNGINAESLRNYSISLVATVSGWPVPVVEMLPVSKLNEAAAWLSGFTDGGPATGNS